MTPSELIKQTFSDLVVIGVFKDFDRYENLAYNHQLLKRGKFNRVTDTFAYFITTKRRFIEGVGAAFRSDDWLAGLKNGDEVASDWNRYRDFYARAKTFLDSILESRFYSSLFGIESDHDFSVDCTTEDWDTFKLPKNFVTTEKLNLPNWGEE